MLRKKKTFGSSYLKSLFYLFIQLNTELYCIFKYLYQLQLIFIGLHSQNQSILLDLVNIGVLLFLVAEFCLDLYFVDLYGSKNTPQSCYKCVKIFQAVSDSSVTCQKFFNRFFSARFDLDIILNKCTSGNLCLYLYHARFY
eukprot:TRINITY_DN4075_c0_g1_i5.p2 TRINITY_DN4075_c0_g1~~TRINITY_DN4075_c0_g1_i5.p2  ORF type:complete len:141 (-),score=1.62 TRINITY_DN4075_c0_g1_i5:78-500(-)